MAASEAESAPGMGLPVQLVAQNLKVVGVERADEPDGIRALDDADAVLAVQLSARLPAQRHEQSAGWRQALPYLVNC